MQYCEKCKVKITGLNKCCPLCGGDLTGNIDENSQAFPKVAKEKYKKHILLKAFILSSVAAAFICALVPFCFCRADKYLAYNRNSF